MTTARTYSIPSSKHLTEQMLALGYSRKLKNGICFGLAHMGKQAILLNQLHQFDQRLSKLNQVLDITAFQTSPLSEEAIDTLAFFDGICSYHDPLCLPLPRGAETAQTSLYHQSLITPHQLAEEGGIIEIGTPFSGMLDKKEIVVYLKNLKQAQATLGNPPPFALVLGSEDHSLTISHVIGKKKSYWVMIDAAQLSSRLCKTDAEDMLAERILQSFTANNIAGFSTRFYGTKRHKHVLKAMLSAWQQPESFQAIYTPTGYKACVRDSSKVNWLNLAISNQEYSLALALLELEADTNTFKTSRGDSILHRAVGLSHSVELVEALLSKNANPNAVNASGLTPLHLAVLMNEYKMVKALVRAGADTEIIDANGSTLCQLAMARNFYEIVTFLTLDLPSKKKRPLAERLEEGTAPPTKRFCYGLFSSSASTSLLAPNLNRSGDNQDGPKMDSASFTN